MTLKTTRNLETFLRTLASGETIAASLAAIGSRSEQNLANWLKAARADDRPLTENGWTVRLMSGGDPLRFDQAYEQARLISMITRRSDMRSELEARLAELRANGPKHSRPESVATARQWEPTEHVEGDGHGPPKPRPQTLLDHPRAYYVEAPTPRPDRLPYRAAPAINGSNRELPEGGFSMSKAYGVHQEISRAEARSGKPRIVGFGVKVD